MLLRRRIEPIRTVVLVILIGRYRQCRYHHRARGRTETRRQRRGNRNRGTATERRAVQWHSRLTNEGTSPAPCETREVACCRRGSNPSHTDADAGWYEWLIRTAASMRRGYSTATATTGAGADARGSERVVGTPSSGRRSTPRRRRRRATATATATATARRSKWFIRPRRRSTTRSKWFIVPRRRRRWWLLLRLVFPISILRERVSVHSPRWRGGREHRRRVAWDNGGAHPTMSAHAR